MSSDESDNTGSTDTGDSGNTDSQSSSSESQITSSSENHSAVHFQAGTAMHELISVHENGWGSVLNE